MSAPDRQGDANRPFLAVKPGASGDITLKPGTTSNEFIVWMQPRVAGYTPSALVHAGKAYLVHDTGILNVLDAKSGKQIYKARVGGGGHTFSASPVGVRLTCPLPDRRRGHFRARHGR